ncbi:hypothetical protein Goari_023818, partial [Gossypium aridum]|nr:hypothetical protein [Gossypium aridum]MBA0682066.1 hypothetical protein [Gossypium aridum]
CVPSHTGGNRYQVECGPSDQHVVDLVENSCSYKNWDLTGIPCMHAVAVKRHKVGVHNQVVAPTHQEVVAPRGKLPFKRKPTIVR